MTTINLSSTANLIAYNPEADAIYGYTLGAALPADIWHGRHPYVASPRLENAVSADVAAWAEERVGLFKQATGADDDAAYALLQLEEELQAAIDGGDIRHYASAGDYLHGDVLAVLDAALTYKSISAAAAAEVASAEDVVLRTDDVAEALRELLAERLAERLDEGPEALDEVDKIRALLMK